MTDPRGTGEQQMDDGATSARTLKVRGRHTGAEGVVVLDLVDPEGAELPAWLPGAHVDLEVGGLTRQYSLCGDPADRWTWRIAVLREPRSRGGSEHVHQHLHQGHRVVVRGPRNLFPLLPAPRYVFIAGGIGITPILAMVRRAAATGAEWELHYGGRGRRSMAFLADLAALTDDRVQLHPEDEVGLIDLPAVLGRPASDTLVYACGPGPLLDAVEQHCRSWPDGSLHVERFRPRDEATSAQSGEFEVHLRRRDLTVRVPADQSVLEVVEAAGVTVLSSCQEGTCGTCETTVLEGTVDHRDSLLTPAEQAANDTMFICVSRAAGPRLVLDL